MPRLTLPLALILLATTTTPALAQDDSSSSADAWSATRVLGDLDFPVDLAFGPDGTLYYAELATGNVRAVPPGADAPLEDAVLRVPASPGGNGGLLGLALDPAFEDTGAFFVYYTLEKPGAENGKVNRVSRVSADGTQTVLVDDIPWANMHDGGRLAFTGPDTLVVTTGDNEKREPAQDPESLLGKTLRITRAGDPAPGNPDPESIVFTLGHRNPFGLAYDPVNDVAWVTENGPDRGDEVNVLEPGGNYGWPHALGPSDDPRFVDPVFTFDAPIGPTGATVLHGVLYFGDFNHGRVHSLERASEGAVTHDVVWEVPYSGGHVLDVEAGPDGRLYVGTYSEVFALTPPGGAKPPAPGAGDAGAPDGADGNGTAESGGEDEGADPDAAGGAEFEGPAGGGAEARADLPEEAVPDTRTPAPDTMIALTAMLAVALTRGGRARRE